MKKLFFTIPVILLAFFISNASVLGQDNTKLLFDKRVQLDGKTETQEITMPFKDSLDYVSIKINAVIQSGELTVELYSPSGEKYGNFSISGEIRKVTKNEELLLRGHSYSTGASGNLLRTIKEPQRGIWKAKLISKKAVGVINFQFTKESILFKTS